MTNRITTKDKIANSARGLFNTYGIPNITIRKIAAEVGMSSGNLTYHFKSREEIVAYLYFQMVEVFDKQVDNVQQLEFSITNFCKSSLMNFERMLDYKFIWLDLQQTLRESDAVKKHFTATRKKRKIGFVYMMHKFYELKLVRGEKFDGEYEVLANNLVLNIDFWIASEAIYGPKIGKQKLKKNHDNFIKLLFPYLTQKGIRETLKL